MTDQAELDREDGVADEPSTGEVRAADSQESGRQTKQAGNLDDDPRFRQWKSVSDRQLSAAQQAAQAARQEAEQARLQAQQIYMQTLDDQGKIQYLLQLKDEEINNLKRQRESDARLAQWRLDMEEIHRETGIPYEELADVTNSYDAWKKGNAYLKKQGGGGKRSRANEDDEPEQRQVDDRVDVGGGGKPPSARTRYQQEYDKALELADWNGMQLARDKAARANVRLLDKQGREMS